MTARARELHALREMRHVVMNAEQLVAMAQPLSLRVDEKKYRAARMVTHRLDHPLRHRERQLDADLGMVGRTDHGEGGVAALSDARKQIAARDDVVAAIEETFRDGDPIHDRSSGSAHVFRQCDQRIGREERHAGRLVEPEIAPDILTVPVSAEARETRFEQLLLMLDGCQRQVFTGPQSAGERCPKRRLPVVDQYRAVAHQESMLAADGSPYE